MKKLFVYLIIFIVVQFAPAVLAEEVTEISPLYRDAALIDYQRSGADQYLVILNNTDLRLRGEIFADPRFEPSGTGCSVR